MKLTEVFSIEELIVDTDLVATIQLNNEHPVFQGHFPNNPIVPGVCLMEMVKQVISKYYQQQYTISNGNNIKFLAVLNPVENPKVTVKVSLKDDNKEEVAFNSSISTEEITFVKFKGAVKTTL